MGLVEATQFRSIYVGSDAGEAPVWLPDGSVSIGGAKTWFVSTATELATAIAALADGDTICMFPGTYASRMTIAKNSVTIVGLGPRGSVILAPASGTTTTVTVNGQFVTFRNLDITTYTGTAVGTVINGDSFTAIGCKFETDDDAGIALQFAGAGTEGLTASLAVIEGCEFAWAATGIQFTYSVLGTACTQSRVSRCWFHNLSAAAIGEEAGGGMSCANLVVEDCTFDDAEDGTAPTAYILLNGTNTNTGLVTRCSFPTAIDGGLNLVSTAIHWVSNFHTGGVSTAQPS